MNLYIIGNGFDLYHGIRSEYSHFKKFVKDRDRGIFDYVERYFQNIDCGEKYWANLESSFADIDVDNLISDCEMFLSSYGADDWSDSGHHDFQFEIEKIVTSLSSELKSQFVNWIDQIEIPSADVIENTLLPLDAAAHYLSFNYTETLETIYGIPLQSILHIHGRTDYINDEIILGHGWNPDNRASLNDNLNIMEQDTRVMEAYGIIDDYFSATFKPSAKIIVKHDAFFASLGSVEKITILGHSMSDVDWPYFEAVAARIDLQRVKWVVACCEQNEIEDKSETIKRLGVPENLVYAVLWEDVHKV